MKRHQLKCNPESFWLTVEGKKPFSIRRNDRDYQVGDLIDLHEFKKGNYTGYGTTQRINCICDFEQKPGYVVLGLEEALGESGAVDPSKSMRPAQVALENIISMDPQ